MKRNILFAYLLIAIFMFPSNKAFCENPSITLKKAVLVLEANIKWQAVQQSWRTRRKRWISDVKQSGSPYFLAKLIMELEGNIKWSAVYKRWRRLRRVWLGHGRRAKSIVNVCDLLIGLENNVKFSAVNTTWRNIRKSWQTKLKSLKEH